MAEKKECENCKHGDVYFKDEPCRSCDEHYSLWESLTYTPPDTAPPDELDKEAQSLVDMFYEKMAFQSTELRRHEIAKQCAIIHVQGLIDENDSMFKMAELHMDARAIIVLSERLSQLNTLKQKIEAL